jgi:hypothetical protein
MLVCTSNATISGREWRNEVMRALRFALRCMVMLDLASPRSPPRHHCRAFFNRDESYKLLWSAATDCNGRIVLQARRRRTLQGSRTQMSNAAFSGREQHSEVMRAVRIALRCNAMLDSASFNTPPRLTAAPFTIVTNLTRCIGARQPTAKHRQPCQRGGVHALKGTATQMSNAANQRARVAQRSQREQCDSRSAALAC